MRGRPPPWPPRAIPLVGDAHRRLGRGEFFGTYLAHLPDLAALRPLAAAGQTGCSRILAGHRVSCCWRPAGLCVRVGCTGGVQHRSATSPGPVRTPGLTCGSWWQVQDSNLGRLSSAIFTDPARYCPDLGEHQSNPPFWHAFDMTTRRVSHPPLRVRTPDRPAARAGSHATGQPARPPAPRLTGEHRTPPSGRCNCPACSLRHDADERARHPVLRGRRSAGQQPRGTDLP